MEIEKSQAEPAATVTSQPSESSRLRLVIRVEITPEAPLKSAVPQRLNRRTLALVLGVAALLTLTGLAFSVLRSGPTSASVVNEASDTMEPQPPVPTPTSNEVPPEVRAAPPAKLAPLSTERGSANATSAEARSATTAPVKSDAPGQPLNEVIPDVPQSALQTIRGTVRVSIRVIIDDKGTVIEAASADPGPSRYFERLSLEAAKKWTFAPTNSPEQRIMLVRFHFTREGTTAFANPSP